MGVYVCPVCSGRGFVDSGFYLSAQNLETNFNMTCKSCRGKGIVFDEVQVPEYRITDEDARSYIGYCTYGDYLRGNLKK